MKKEENAISEGEGVNENGLMFTFVFRRRDITVSVGQRRLHSEKL